MNNMPRFVGGGVLHEINAQATAVGGLCRNDKAANFSRAPATWPVARRPADAPNLAFIMAKWPVSAPFSYSNIKECRLIVNYKWKQLKLRMEMELTHAWS